MIELRWKVRKGGMRTALQFRTWRVRLDASGAISPCPLPVEWTEWKTVPYAIEGDQERARRLLID